MSLFIRLLETEDKEQGLNQAIDQLNAGQSVSYAYAPDSNSFAQVPGSPFAYWVSDSIRSLFTRLEPFDNGVRTAKQGLATADDFRFVRFWAEVPPKQTLDGLNGPDWNQIEAFQAWCRERTTNKRWVNFAKGGAYSPYYADVHLILNWGSDGFEMKAWADPLYGNSGWSRIIKSVDYYFRPGLTWPRRTNGLSFRCYSSGLIFADKGPVAFLSNEYQLQDLFSLASFFNSSAFGYLMALQLARTELAQSFEVGLVNQTPVPDLDNNKLEPLSEKVRQIIEIKQARDQQHETSHLFVQPWLSLNPGQTLKEQFKGLDEQTRQQNAIFEALQAEIDVQVYELYQISVADQATIAAGFKAADAETADNKEAEDETEQQGRDPTALSHDLVSWLIGVALARWDIRFATGKKQPPELPDPFAPLPVCPPGMLQNEEGLPINPADVERLKQAGQWYYPLELLWDGILVDDPGHARDLEARLHQVMQIIWPENWESIEQEACQILGVKSLRAYFRKPAGFFADHLKRYSKSRRQAPIYWPLSTASGSYTLWIYYHRLTDQTLYTAINNYVEPKLKLTQKTLRDLRLNNARTPAQESEFESLQTLETELMEFHDELLRLAQLPWKPNLNDGVQITAAPLWKLFKLPKWQKTLKDTWQKLEKGECDWAHLAYSIWPHRVREKCKKDKSLAIAHGLEVVYIEPEAKPKKTRSKKTVEDQEV